MCLQGDLVWVGSNDPCKKRRSKLKDITQHTKRDQRRKVVIKRWISQYNDAQAMIRDTIIKQKMTQKYKRKVIPIEFTLGNIVLKKEDVNNKNTLDRIPVLKWERPNQVVDFRERAYTLETLVGKAILHT